MKKIVIYEVVTKSGKCIPFMKVKDAEEYATSSVAMVKDEAIVKPVELIVYESVSDYTESVRKETIRKLRETLTIEEQEAMGILGE